MYSLERLFYTVAAFTAFLAFCFFTLFFDVGAMITAAFRGPGAFAEWNMRKKIREARRFGAPEEIMPDESRGKIGWSSSRELQGAAAYRRPYFSIKGRLKKARLGLAQQGFTDETFLEMEAYYRVDRAYNAGVVGIERLMVRGNHAEALDRLEVLLSQVNNKNRRAVSELLLIKLQLYKELRTPPEEIYDLYMQRLELLLEIARIEVRGYKGVPRFQRRLQRSEVLVQGLEEQIARFRQHREKALTLFNTGLAFGEFPPALAAKLQEGVRKVASEKGASPQQTQRALHWIQTRVHHPPEPE